VDKVNYVEMKRVSELAIISLLLNQKESEGLAGKARNERVIEMFLLKIKLFVAILYLMSLL